MLAFHHAFGGIIIALAILVSIIGDDDIIMLSAFFMNMILSWRHSHSYIYSTYIQHKFHNLVNVDPNSVHQSTLISHSIDNLKIPISSKNTPKSDVTKEFLDLQNMKQKVIFRTSKESNESDHSYLRLDQIGLFWDKNIHDDLSIVSSSGIFVRNPNLKHMISEKGFTYNSESVMAHKLYAGEATEQLQSEYGVILHHQINGNSNWTIINPLFSHLLCPYIDRAYENSIYSVIRTCLYDLNLTSSEFQEYISRIPRYQVELRAGEVLVIPPWWWHMSHKGGGHAPALCDDTTAQKRETGMNDVDFVIYQKMTRQLSVTKVISSPKGAASNGLIFTFYTGTC